MIPDPKIMVTFAAAILVAYDVSGQAGPASNVWDALQQVPRATVDAGEHPGNVFLFGEQVTIDLPASSLLAATWRATDETGKELARGTLANSTPARFSLGNLPVGWYRIEFFNAASDEVGWTTAAVLSPLSAPTPQQSPICVDSATAWFATADIAKQDKFSRLAALAGVNWIRDRMRWREMQPTPDQFASDTTYDSSAATAHRYGLKVLQVFHDTPRWATTLRGETGRFPADLRHIYRFAQAMGERFHGTVQAWEPWNEANVGTFGGHTMDEICSYQKAAYLGFKAGDPHLTVCWNATTATPTERQTDTLLENETWSYFDTYNIHTYDWCHDYERLWKPARRAACGKPLWITESDRGMTCDPNSPTHDLSPANDRLKAQYVTQSYATSLYAGAQRHFHFILGQYGEGKTQFGLLRADMTPRPGYVALAALGRLLAGAQCLGRLEQADHPQLHVYAFRGQPDGRDRDILVAWTEEKVDWPDRGKSTLQWDLPANLAVEECYDYLGRGVAASFPRLLTSAPTFVILPAGQCNSLPLTKPEAGVRPAETVTPIVLQCLMPKESASKIERIPWAWEIEHTTEPDIPANIKICLYNFADHDVQGTVSLEQAPSACHLQPDSWTVSLKPMGRQELPVLVTISKDMTSDVDGLWIKLRGEFGADGRPVLAFRLIASQGDSNLTNEK